MQTPITLLTFLLAMSCICSCQKKSEQRGPLNLSDDFAFCNSRLVACTGGDGNYCLFGYKWGTTPEFASNGYNALGPQEAGGVITFSFQQENGLVNTHAQINLPSRSFSSVIDCAQEEIRKAFDAWAVVANLSFRELPENTASDIKIFVADTRQSGIGYPNYADSLCQTIAGNFMIQRNINITSCDTFYKFALHEIGHILGLGHVSTPNIMNANIRKFDFTELQAGDKQGIIELYGEK